MPGFFDLYWDESKGALYLAIARFDEPFIYIAGLSAGLGSNDIGLDRGQIGEHRVVHFERQGNRVFLVMPNQKYRALTGNASERQAVAESFAQSTLWGGTIAAEADGRVFVDVASLVFADIHDVIGALKEAEEGDYQLDQDRSRYFMARTKSFPDNSEIEVTLTFTGEPGGEEVPEVVPDPRWITLRQHHSFVRLPPPGYRPRAFHPRCGGFDISYFDYAAPLAAGLERRLVLRHRLTRIAGEGDESSAPAPLIYYVDPGAPPRIREALIAGASWWSEAFAAAGYPDTFRVGLLPADADPMDVRYNVIQWVHRSTRGWSYGMPVHDPRTGEIIKGHVTLGSLRVRQDRLLFDSIVSTGAAGQVDAVELALARIRQLAAHEVGHTLGLAHNFAASPFGRASVMDYPAPLLKLEDGRLGTSEAYAEGIGAWDTLAIRYLYGEWEDEVAGLRAVLDEAEAKGLLYLTDEDARDIGTMHPLANLWDNGVDPVAEFRRVLELRDFLLQHFGSVKAGPAEFAAELEEMLVPVYLYHRYQLEACAKNVGGAFYDYGDMQGRRPVQPVLPDMQRQALSLLLATLQPGFLDLPAHLRNRIPPRPQGYGAHRELFTRGTHPAFDPLAMAEASVTLTLEVLLHPDRLNRVLNQWAADESQLSPAELFDALFEAVFALDEGTGEAGALHRLVSALVVEALVDAVNRPELRAGVRAHAWAALQRLRNRFAEAESGDTAYTHHYQLLQARLDKVEISTRLFPELEEVEVPPGSPIGH